MRNSHDIKSPYLTPMEAAAFCKVAGRTFRDYVRIYRIPKRGPGGNRYLIEDIENFMLDSHCFLKLPKPKTAQAPVLYKPVRV